MRRFILILQIFTILIFTGCINDQNSDSKKIESVEDIINIEIDPELKKSLKSYRAYGNPEYSYLSVSKNVISKNETVSFDLTPAQQYRFTFYTASKPHFGETVLVPLTVKSFTWRVNNIVVATSEDLNYTFSENGIYTVEVLIEYNTVSATVEGQTKTANPTKTHTSTISVVEQLSQDLLKAFKTGQTLCYSYKYNKEEPCTEEHKGQDGYYKMGLNTNFTRNNSIVTDHVLNLMWQDNSAVSTQKMTLEDARRYCENLTLSGYSDWRLPLVEEIRTIIDYGTLFPALHNPFQNSKKLGYYWTHKGRMQVSGYGIVASSTNEAFSQNFVRCVRSIQ